MCFVIIYVIMLRAITAQPTKGLLGALIGSFLTEDTAKSIHLEISSGADVPRVMGAKVCGGEWRQSPSVTTPVVFSEAYVGMRGEIWSWCSDGNEGNNRANKQVSKQENKGKRENNLQQVRAATLHGEIWQVVIMRL